MTYRINRNILCEKCLDKVRKADAKYMTSYRLKIKEIKGRAEKIVIKHK